MSIAIRVENLSKCFRIGGQTEQYKTMRDQIATAFSTPFRRVRDTLRGNAYATSDMSVEFWALKEIAFDLQQGEVLGLVGRNGAGKSTLLKILSRITEPTTGRIRIEGRVGSLLEVGTGFHQELTGRENIYLNGAILGMKRAEIVSKLDEIIAFAEVEQFIDTPVKHYSSGMALRLGFAVAAHMEPEILIVDEVLAVGDAQFQKKCLGKMSDVAGQGRTVLFVSHNMAAVQSLCSRVIWLKAGSVEGDGPSDQIISQYINEGVSIGTERVWEDRATAPGNDKIRMKRVTIAPTGDAAQPITVSTPLRVEFEYWNLEEDVRLSLWVRLYDEQRTMVFSTFSVYDLQWQDRPFPVGLYYSAFSIPGDLLNEGMYEIEVIFMKDQHHWSFIQSDALVFQVRESPERFQGLTWYGRWPGTVRPKFQWTTQALHEPASSDAAPEKLSQ